jgi:hypothetical protein
MQRRRQFLKSFIAGSSLFPAVVAAASSTADPLAVRAPHFPGKAKRMILLFMTGGVSHVDSFDPKPGLPKALEGGKTSGGRNPRPPLPTNWKYSPRGKCGMEFTDLFPHLANVADDLCLIRSMHGDHNDHFQAVMGVHGGSVQAKRPSMGSWVTYGLGTENRNLPGFVVLAPHIPYGGSEIWSSDFLPAVHSGTRVAGGAEPVADLKRRAVSDTVQRLELDLLTSLNKGHLAGRGGADPFLEARIKSFETAYGMQSDMPAVFDFSKESDATMQLYGLERAQTSGFAWQCLVARRMVERGVRFVELVDSGTTHNWDTHTEINDMEKMAKNVDQAVAGLMMDLKSRGMLDDTLVVWTTEFGRTPWHGNGHGREHYNKCYSTWVAGGGFKRGMVYGSTDELGLEVAENPVHVHDLHATLLHCLGFDHTKLTYRHGGRDHRLTDLYGEVVKDLLV